MEKRELPANSGEPCSPGICNQANGDGQDKMGDQGGDTESTNADNDAASDAIHNCMQQKHMMNTRNDSDL